MITPPKIREYYKNDNLIFRRISKDYGYWEQTDKKNNLVYIKNTMGGEYWYKRNKFGKLKHITEEQFIHIQIFSMKKVHRYEILDI